jgi:hypothetical protein
MIMPAVRAFFFVNFWLWVDIHFGQHPPPKQEHRIAFVPPQVHDSDASAFSAAYPADSLSYQCNNQVETVHCFHRKNQVETVQDMQSRRVHAPTWNTVLSRYRVNMEPFSMQHCAVKPSPIHYISRVHPNVHQLTNQILHPSPAPGLLSQGTPWKTLRKSFMLFDLKASTFRPYPQTEATLMSMEHLMTSRYNTCNNWACSVAIIALHIYSVKASCMPLWLLNEAMTFFPVTCHSLGSVQRLLQ